jgi:hypothetical protein
MKILSLNCQGLQNAPTVRALSDVRRRYNPDVIFLSETHLDDFPAKGLRRKLQMDYKIVNPSNGRSDGVLLFWKKEIKLQQIFSAPKYIDVQISENDKLWRLTGIYGEPKWEDKYKMWDKLRELNASQNLPWIVIGDFNEILFSHEKEGGNPRPPSFMQAFQDALTDCDLEDLGFSGDNFTWKRGRIRERLDKAVANGEWNIMHPGAVLQHLEYTKSDHRPILLDTDYKHIAVNQGKKSKKFEARWLREKGFRDMVEKNGSEASLAVPMGNVLAKLGYLHGAMHAWDASVVQKPKKNFGRLKENWIKH